MRNKSIIIIENEPFGENDLIRWTKIMGYSVVRVNTKESINRIKKMQRDQFLWAVQIGSSEPLSTLPKYGGSSESFWLDSIHAFILRNINSSLLNAEYIAYENAMSTRNLSRRLKKLTGCNTTEYVREIRLKKALYYLEHDVYPSVKMVCYNVGYHDQKYFSKIFRKKFGFTPSELLKQPKQSLL